ncbi:MAG TPA: hypothetical protein PLU87_07125 [Sedimentisphaerales bacterium]|nr:hypothetical protein [Sedimentisphaerales bacterium]HRS10761.1 hypothetical protein [Sedimentisphaerales bacterium]HRV47466.1 hypothetical protein [Sedimentisphaerales bacterium]
MSARIVKLSDVLRNRIGEALKPLHLEMVILLGSSIAEIVREEVHLP